VNDGKWAVGKEKAYNGKLYPAETSQKRFAVLAFLDKNIGVRLLLPLIFFGFSAVAQSSVSNNSVNQAHIPTTFEQNNGQSSDSVQYLLRNNNHSFKFNVKGFSISKTHQNSQAKPINIEIIDGAPQSITGVGKVKTQSNYFIGKSKSQWITNVPHFEKIKYQEIYPNIDLVFYLTEKEELEYDFVVHPGGKVEDISLRLNGVDNISLSNNGSLSLAGADVNIAKSAPVIYQWINEQKKFLAGRYILTGQELAFSIDEPFDETRPLYVDPIISLSTYVGDESSSIQGLARDEDGYVYIYGYLVRDGGNKDAYLSKISPSGNIEWTTYLGGLDDEEQSGTAIGETLALDQNNNIYVTGLTSSTDYPLLNPYQSVLGGAADFYVTKLHADGSTLLYSTYLGGDGDPDHPNESTELAPTIDVDSFGNAFIVGFTNSDDFPTVNALQATFAGRLDVIAAKLNSSGNALVFSTYLGGSSDDKARDLTVDLEGNLLITGRTDSDDFPLAYAIETEKLSDDGSAFITKIDPLGSQILFSTYLGGSGTDKGRTITTDSNNDIYIAGSTSSNDFPTSNALQANFQGRNGDGFFTKIDQLTNELVFSSYFGASGADFISDLAVDEIGRVFLVGNTDSTNLSLIQPTQEQFGGETDAFYAVVSSDGSALLASSYIGGSLDENNAKVEVASDGSNFVIASQTDSLDIPQVGYINDFGTGFITLVGDIPEDSTSNSSEQDVEVIPTTIENKSVATGQSDVVMARLRIENMTTELSSITLQANLTNTDITVIKSVKLYLEANGNGQVDGDDILLAEGNFGDDETIVLTLTTPYVLRSGVNYIMVVYDF
jgi:hypothetical protein